MSAKDGDELVFLPLGGSGEIGMNLNAYGYGPPHARKWIIVDLGVTFGGSDLPGVDIILPDPTYLEAHKEDILGIVLTHAHEDHIGAVPWLWPRFKSPIYATPFTAALVREKLRERGLETKAKIIETPLKGVVTLGPFEIEYVTLTHSIPEPNGLAIRTPLGLVWHTGDWKIDPDPLIGETTDEEALRKMRDEGVLAMVCDSTNVFVEEHTGSEADVRDELTKLFQTLKSRIAVAAFASNVARVQSVVLAARSAKRQVCLVGRSMLRVTAAAKAVGVLPADINFITENEAAVLPKHKVLYLCTGSQGEPRAALSRIAAGEHRSVKIEQGDAVVFSSRVIPGNEVSIYALYNRFAERGVEVVTDREWPVHVSGHPSRVELEQMYKWARPKIAVPVHGERRHILEHVRLALEWQTPEALAPRNGDLIRLAPGPAEVIDEVPAGRLYVDGDIIIESDDEAMRERRKMGADGSVTVTMAVNAKKRAIMSGPDVRVKGLSGGDEAGMDMLLDELAEAAELAYSKLSGAERNDEDAAEEIIARAVRRAAEKNWGKRPVVEAVILTV
ncbi:MAG: ribonuclease J [Alphaproteobacteria bacterium]